MPRKTRLPPKPFAQMSPLSQRIELLSRATGLVPSKLSTEAGMSQETIPKMLVQAEKGEIPGTGESYVKIGRRFDLDVGWLLGQWPIDPSAAVPFGTFEKGRGSSE